TELVRVDHRADRLDDSVDDVERKDADDAAVTIDNGSAGLSVHLVELHRQPVVDHLATDAREETADAIAADDRARPERARAAAAGAAPDDVGRQQPARSADVPSADGGEEAFRKPFALASRRFEARLLGFDVTARARGELPAVVFALVDRLRDLGVPVP